MNIEQLAKEYEKSIKHIVCSAEPPTEESVKYIESELGISLPRSLVSFARASKNYGNWLASIGPDYDSYNHIIAINKELANEGKLPKSFIAINVGYDDDYSCIDIETYDETKDEYLITYWAGDVPQSESDLSESFPQYMEKNIEYWSKNA